MRPEVKRILVLGGSNTDLTAAPRSGQLVRGTSNPGRVVLAPGGVGRNIAANLGYLGLPVSLLSAVEDSPLGDSLLAMTEAAGVDVSRVRRGEPGESGVYVAVHDGSGDLAVAVSDMGVADRVDSEYVEANRSLIEDAAYLVMDANAPAEAMERALSIATGAGVPVIADPVSLEKGRRLAALEGRLFLATPNREEAKVLLRGTVAVDHFVVTRGALGVGWLAPEAERCRLFAPEPVAEGHSSGAGDAFVAGLVARLYEGGSMEEAIKYGIGAARLILRLPETTTPELSPESVEEEVKRCFYR